MSRASLGLLVVAMLTILLVGVVSIPRELGTVSREITAGLTCQGVIDLNETSCPTGCNSGNWHDIDGDGVGMSSARTLQGECGSAMGCGNKILWDVYFDPSCNPD